MNDLLKFPNTENQPGSTVHNALNHESVRLLTESFTDYAILTLDPEGVIKTWNPGAEQMFGYAEDEVIGKPAHIIFTPEDIAKGAPEFELNTAREKGRAADERWHIRKDGTRFYVSGIMASMRDSNDNLIGFAKIGRDLTSQKQLEEELHIAREGLETRVAERTGELASAIESLKKEIVDRKHSEDLRVGLLGRIVTTQEDERRRIARDLHDNLGQGLTALRLKIASLKELCGDDEILCERVSRLQEIAAQIDAEVNFLAWELRPSALDDLGLVAAIGHYVQEWSRHWEIPADFHSFGLRGKRLDPEVETNLYRIAQEAMNNILKHAKASNVSVLLELRDEQVVLIIEDNGIGFDLNLKQVMKTSGTGFGLIGMRERATIVSGTLEIESILGNGTTIFVHVPSEFVRKINLDD